MKNKNTEERRALYMDKLLGLVRIVLLFFVVVWLFWFLRCIFRRLFFKERFEAKDFLVLGNTIKEKPVISSIIIVVVLFVYLYYDATFTELLGIQKPLSERGNGTYCYYVEALEENTEKEYTVPARITVESWVEDDGNGRTSGGYNYFIEQLCFDDGSIVNFGDSAYNEDASFKAYTRYYDENGYRWKCKLTEQHAYSKLVQETSFISTYRVFELFIIIFVVLFNLLGGLYLAGKEKRVTSMDKYSKH